MLKVLTYDSASITFELVTEGVNCTLKNNRPEAAEIWSQFVHLAGIADNSNVGLTLARDNVLVRITIPRDDLESIGYELIQFLNRSRAGAKARGEPATAFDHPSVRWTEVKIPRGLEKIPTNSAARPLDAWRRALHEAGHALVSLTLGDPFRLATMDIIIDETVDRGGVVTYDAMPTDCQVEYTTALEVVVMTLGGWAAEFSIFREHSRNAKTDTENVIELLRQLEPDEVKMVPLMHRCMDLALDLLSNHDQLRRLADVLHDRGTLNRLEIDEVLGPVAVRRVNWDAIWQPD